MNTRLKTSYLLFAALLFLLSLPMATELAQGKGKGSGGGGGGGGNDGPTVEYEIYQLDSDEGAFSGFAADVNDVGSVVGEVADTITGEKFAAHWDLTIDSNGTVTSSLSLLPGASGTRATGVNNVGEVVGGNPLLGGVGSGLYWPSVLSQPLSLRPLSGDTDASPNSINDAGIIGGVSTYYVSTPEGSIQEERPVVWRITRNDNGPPTVLGPFQLPSVKGIAWDLSEADTGGAITVAGDVWGDEFSAAVTWQIQLQSNGGVFIDPQPTILQVGANVRGINNTGVACGDSSRPDWIAMLWTETDQTSLPLPRKFASSGAWDVNDSGVVVGWVSEQIGFPPGLATVWAGLDSKPVLLSSFLGRRSPFDGLTDAPAINQAGVIVGAGWDGNDGVQQAFIALPN